LLTTQLKTMFARLFLRKGGYTFKSIGKKFQNFRQYNIQRLETTSKNNYILGTVGIVGLVAGGYLLNKALNAPVILETPDQVTSYGTVAGQIPSHVREYLANTYKKVLLGLGITAGSAYAAFKSGLAFRIFEMNPLAATLLFVGGTIGTMIWTRAVDPRNVVHKHIAYTAFSALMGVSLCTIGFFGPHIIFRAALYTAGVFAALSFTAMNARQDRFLNWGGPLFAGLTVMVLASFTGLLLPAKFVKTLALIDALVLYGGLVLFGAYLLYDTQKIMHRANRRHLQIQEVLSYKPNAKIPPADYINEAISIYLDIINIFIRIVQILGNSKRK